MPVELSLNVLVGGIPTVTTAVVRVIAAPVAVRPNPVGSLMHATIVGVNKVVVRYVEKGLAVAGDVPSPVLG